MFTFLLYLYKKMNTYMERKHFFTIEVVRAITIILVVIGHYSPDNAPLWYNSLLKFIYSFHMPVFLFISGFIYIATKKEESYLSFLFKKVKRLLIPYFSTSVIIISIKLFSQGNAYLENPVTINSYFEIFYLPVAGYFLWFIIALWWMFVITPLFKTRKLRLCLFLISAIIAYLPFEPTHILCANEFKRMFIYFMLGVTLYDYKEYFNTIINRFSHSFIPLIFFIVLEYIYLLKGCNMMECLLPFVGIIVTMQLANSLTNINSTKIKNMLFQVASSSYLIYLFHTTFEGFAKSIVIKCGLISNDLSFVVCAFFILSLGIIGPICLNQIFKKVQYTRFLFGLKP